MWYTKSTNGGVNWVGEILISTLRQGTLNPQNPSLCSFTSGGTSYLQVVWVEDYGAAGYAFIRFLQCINGTWESNISIGPPFYRNNYDSKPVVDKGWVAYDIHNNNIEIVKFLSSTGHTDTLRLPSGQGKNPAIYSDVSDSTTCHIIYEDPSNGTIQYRKCILNTYNNTLSWSGNAIDISSGSNRSNNCNPSFASVSRHISYAAWQGLNTTNNRTEIIVRNIAYGVGQGFTYFGSSSLCSQDINFLRPSINDIGNNDVGIAWQTAGGNLWYAKGRSTEWTTSKLNVSGASYPNISNQTDGSTINAVCTRNSGSAPYQIMIASPATPLGQPPAPTLSWTIDGENPRLNWTSSGDDMLYKLYRYKCPPGEDCFPAVKIYEGAATSYKDWHVTVYRKGQSMEPGSQFYYYVTASNYICQTSPSSNTVGVLEGLYPAVQKQSYDDKKLIPDKFSLSDNFPNPFNPTTNIFYDLPEDAYVVLKVFDVLGREVTTLVDEFQDAGYKSVSFDAWDLPSGVYYYKIQAGDFVDVKKMLLVR